MRPVIVLATVLVAGCSAPGSGNGSPQQAEVQERGYVPKPNRQDDEQPWASAFVNWTFGQAGVRGTGDRHALSWLGWGVPLRQPAVGAVAVLDYGHARGHVGLVVGAYKGMIVLLGGDQRNAVKRTAFPPEDITAYRWPAGWPIPTTAYSLPTVRPDGAPDADGSPRGNPGKTVPADDSPSIGTIEYRSRGGEQSLRMRRLADDRIRFELQNKSCRRTITGTAYEIYPGDAQVDAESGIGYPAREYFFWADSLGERGLAIRLSIAGPPRARATEWGYRTQCPYADVVMHGDTGTKRLAVDASRSFTGGKFSSTLPPTVRTEPSVGNARPSSLLPKTAWLAGSAPLHSGRSAAAQPARPSPANALRRRHPTTPVATSSHGEWIMGDKDHWPFDQARNVAAISDRRVFERGLPIRFVAHYSDDHSWGFLSEQNLRDEDGMVVGMGAVVSHDPTLLDVADLPPGWTATRERVGGHWVRRQAPGT